MIFRTKTKTRPRNRIPSIIFLKTSIGIDDATLQNFIYKHTLDLQSVQRNKKKEKGELTSRQVSSNSPSQKPTTSSISMSYIDCLQ
jgi:hypothetical protein